MKFKTEKVSSLQGHTEVRQTLEDTTEDQVPFVIAAAPQGIQLRGVSPYLGSIDELDSFAQAIDRAWREHLKLRPKLSQTLSGH